MGSDPIEKSEIGVRPQFEAGLSGTLPSERWCAQVDATYYGLMTTPAPAPSPTLREFDVGARSTDVFGRVLCATRNHHFIVDGPVQNGCPGEEITPVEMFLSAVAACGVELLHVIAKQDGVPLERAAVKIHAWNDRTKQARPDLNTLNSVRLDFTVWGADNAQAAALVEGFKRR